CPVQAHNQFHVLANCRRVKAAGIHYYFSSKKPECAGNDQQGIEKTEGDAAPEERSQIFDYLKTSEQVSGDFDLRDLSVLHFATIGDADNAAAGHSAVVCEKRYC